jgi:acetyl esterase/lipase
MIKRAMEVFYASVGTAIDITGQDSTENPNENAMWQVPLVTAAMASFYSVTGARGRVVEVTSSSRSAQRLIKEAWGMVSLPSVKNLSLQASRLLKGAAVADRIEICGVPCFILSREPAPELAAAIKRNRRMHRCRKPIATLSTIDEQEELSPSTHNTNCCRRPFARSSSTRYRQRDVIFHLTGGGFFAHIIASDLPYLLDWSAMTGAVVICPEYALLPEHTFPFALNQIERVYQALVSDEAVPALGFETNTIVVTGESAGGNLAAALCVKIGTAAAAAAVVDDDGVLVSSRNPPVEAAATERIRMPGALMLSCPVLNLSLELSLSRVAGTNDPVLPSGLLTAISDAYLPPELGISKREPLASPLFASDQILNRFPPTLLFASSQDPLLDDSVVFNQRLRSVGVDSSLFAANNMPHAYLGLGTAGFPEAQQVQQLCVSWLNQQLANEPRRTSS